MGVYKVVRVVEIIEYVEAENEIMAESTMRCDHTELIHDENVLSCICEDADMIDVKTYWINKNSR